MPTTDTFIIPPMQPEEEPKKEKKEKKEKKKSGGSKTFLFIGLVLLIITLPVAIYFITQQQQIADTRSRAAPLIYQCSGGESRCQTNADGTNTGFICTCASTPKGREWSCGKRDSSCPTGTSNSSGSTAGTRTSPDGTAGGCGYIQKPPLSGLKPCNEETCGMNCGKYTYDCGQLCFDGSCGGTGCASGEGVGAKAPEEVATAAEPTATPEPTAIPTTAPTSAPNSSQCDASCSTDSNCVSGLSCASVDGINRCRNASCPAESTCSCPSAANTPEPTTPPTDDTVYADTTTGDAMPVSGIGPGIIGSITVVGSVFLLLIGLAL